eukprot:TRINITY_DN4236_c0_g1_i1.p1 TRINITY_DN4236_c0_g1~~TRINITY_DN4236_c0_g1_i1.p1  ORF type:complete len:177 (+),score=31.91 TRINITY_DN4236_c0_g1_i1:1573-2103(+)
MTGYTYDEIVGKNCRFLQGKYTNPQTVKELSKAITNGQTICVELLNYQKEGRPFWNNFVVYPVKNKTEVFSFIAVQKDLELLDLSDITKFLKKKPLEMWKPEEVSIWIETNKNLSVYGHYFMKKGVTGEELMLWYEMRESESMDELKLEMSDKDWKSFLSILGNLVDTSISISAQN